MFNPFKEVNPLLEKIDKVNKIDVKRQMDKYDCNSMVLGREFFGAEIKIF